MKFIDECQIQVKAGKGGDGIISFRREYRVDKGGPDGGDGGDGGSIYFVGDKGINTLYKIKFLQKINGNDGEDGRRKNQYGAKGEDIFIKVPLGTLVFVGDQLRFDIVTTEPILIAKGGRGGRGNLKFKTHKNVAPRLCENGSLGETFNLKLSLKVLADVGFVGLPSAGKSTILAKISNAKPKIGDYPFTTLVPQLGITWVDEHDFVVADLPGLIQGASQGKGLGHEFLKHVERCRLIAHVIDFGSSDANPIRAYEIINEELKAHQLGLETRAQVVIGNKSDLVDFALNLEEFQRTFPHVKVVAISALLAQNIVNLKRALWEGLAKATVIEAPKPAKEVTITLEKDLIVTHPYHDLFVVEGKEVAKYYQKIPLNSFENFRRFNQKMKDLGLWEVLHAKNIKNGDTVQIYGYQFTWDDEEFADNF